MAKMTQELIQTLYEHGKSVYEGRETLDEATVDVRSSYPGLIATASANFYIGLYGNLIAGKGSTWNQNSDLLLYYVEHIYNDSGKEAAEKALFGAMKFARMKSRQPLIIALTKIAADYNLELMEQKNSTTGKTIADDYMFDWWPSESEYSPGITKDQWLHLLNNQSIIGPVWGGALAMFYTEKEGATCTEIGTKFGKDPASIRSTCTQLGQRIYNTTKCPVLEKNGQYAYTPIMFLSRDTLKGEKGSSVWKLRPELFDALTEFGIERFLPSYKQTTDMEEIEKKAPVSVKEAIRQIKDYIAAKGFSYPNGLVENFFLSLKSKPFVILAGTSGTGKTRLVQLFAEAIGAEYLLVSVRPDWSDGSDLFGHNDLNGNFNLGPICEAFDKANADPDKPVLVCMDEMNLARVEYYLSDFLSVIESRERQDGHIRTVPIAQYKQGIPENLFIVGTVNMDETTFPFSKKVLDRANTIEFNFVDLTPGFEASADDCLPLALTNGFLRTEYLILNQDCAAEAEYVKRLCAELQRVNEILLTANAHVGYRVRDEIVFYMLNNKKSGLLSEDKALDNEILQKILPRIQGSSTAIKEMLIKLFGFCREDYSGLDVDGGKLGKQIQVLAESAKYPESAKKIGYMIERFEEDGFTSYWL